MSLIEKLWLIIRYRPFFKCPCCRGAGGWTDYWGEWGECYVCWEHWERLLDFGMSDWWQGRMPLFARIRYCFIGDTCHRTISGWLRCKLGFHRYETMECGGGVKVCKECFKMECE